MSTEYSGSSGTVCAGLGISDADDALVKSDLAVQIAAMIERRGLTPMQAADVMGIDQSRVSRIVRGHLNRYSIDRLLHFLILLSRDVTIVIGDERSGHRGSMRVHAG